MDNKIKTVIQIVIFAAFLGIVYFVYTGLSDKYQSNNQKTTDQTTKQENNNQTAPDFIVCDGTGKEVKLSDYKGRPVVLNFWASWCPPCKSEMPHFNKIYAESKNDVVFMMVDLVDGQRETQSEGQKYISDQGYSFPVYFDNTQDAANAYGITSIPTTVFIDPEGNIVIAYRGAISKAKLKAAIDLIKK
jgi:thiol-disulfide isomerase/thioredoxin